MDYKREIINELIAISGKYSVHSIFEDWVHMLAISISNCITIDEMVYKRREKEYLQIASKYSSEELKRMAKLNAYLTFACEEKMEDVLGYIYMHLEISSSRLGQFFTPYHLCQLLAQVGQNKPNEDGLYVCNEPSCGAGGNIIALAEKLKEEGINYQKYMRAICQDLDWKAIYMCYVQMSLYGIPAKVIQGDTLKMEEPNRTNIYITPAYALTY